MREYRGTIADLRTAAELLSARRYQPDWPLDTDQKKRLDILYSVVVMYNTTSDHIWIDGREIRPEIKKLRRMKHEIPSSYSVRCSDITVKRGFCPVRRAKVVRPTESPCGYLARPRDSQPSAIRRGRQARVGLAPRYFQGKCPRT